MGLPKQKFRESVLQILFAYNYIKTEEKDLTLFMMNQLKTTKKNICMTQSYVNDVIKNLGTIDQEIKESSKSYDFDRISKLELNILRLGIYEIKYNKEVPNKVAIAEAIRLCKKFATPQSATFVNAILDIIHKKTDGNTKKQES